MAFQKQLNNLSLYKLLSFLKKQTVFIYCPKNHPVGEADFTVSALFSAIGRRILQLHGQWLVAAANCSRGKAGLDGVCTARKERLLLTRSGFTLVEIVMVIVILGVLGIVGADFISLMFRGFADTNSRLEMYEEGKTALVRMERELHGMLPNAICVTNDLGATCVSGNNPGSEIRFGMIAEDVMRSSGLVGGYTEQAVSFPQVAPAKLTDTNP